MTYTGNQEAVICIGSNCGNRNKRVEAALKWLSEILRDFRHSHIYATPDCKGGQREYMNAVCLGKTSLSYSMLETLFKEYELKNGRNRAARETGDVPVDVDVVVYGDVVLRERDYESDFFRIGYRTLNNQQ